MAIAVTFEKKLNGTSILFSWLAKVFCWFKFVLHLYIIYLEICELHRPPKSQAVPESSKFYVLQHVSANFLRPVQLSCFALILKTSVLAILLKFSCKKVVIMFCQFAESIYLCIRNREGHPLRV